VAGQTCAATHGWTAQICGDPAVRVDEAGRPACGFRSFLNLHAHISLAHPELTPEEKAAALDRSSAAPDPPPEASAGQDPPPAEADPPPVALAAQDPPRAEPASSGDGAGADQPLTLAAVRDLIDDALQVFARDVLGMTASMAQGPGVAVHPVGLCDDGTCAPCRSQRREEHVQARQLLADEIDLAFEWAGRAKVTEKMLIEGTDALADVLESWRDAGRPEPDVKTSGRIRVVRRHE